MPSRPLVRCRLLRVTMGVTAVVLALLAFGAAGAGAQTISSSKGELDCNGDSPAQQSARMTMNCTDIRGFANENNPNTWDGRFYDNGTYIGHDEPDMSFFSNQPGSGSDVTWTETLGQDPSALPTVKTPGSDVSHWFELTAAPWLSMMMCDPNSEPQNPCRPESDANAPDPCTISANPCPGGFTGGGSAFMEMQLYPPGFSPFADAISCDNSHWCAALTIDSLECTYGFVTCNPKCEEPVNFAFIQRNGVPAGPPGPESADLQSETPNSQTLLMNPGDKLVIHMFDARAPGGRDARAFEVVIDDLTTHQSGFMQASAANGFGTTSAADCTSTPFNFQPEYNTAGYDNVTPWGAIRTNISTEFETGHFEACTSLSDPGSDPLGPGITDVFYSTCNGPYENTAPGGDGATDPEVSDAPCYPKGDTHGALNTPPDEVTGCYLIFTQNGDLDFDGTPYWPEWPTSARPTPTLPGSFVSALPSTGRGRGYPLYQVQTDLALSESTCAADGSGCSVPPPNAPGRFYPYWSRVGSGNYCALEFGNVSSGSGVNDLGGDAQYGTDQQSTLGYPEFLGPLQRNTCGFSPHKT